jgi:hypothetical protein
MHHLSKNAGFKLERDPESHDVRTEIILQRRLHLRERHCITEFRASSRRLLHYRP